MHADTTREASNDVLRALEREKLGDPNPLDPVPKVVFDHLPRHLDPSPDHDRIAVLSQLKRQGKHRPQREQRLHGIEPARAPLRRSGVQGTPTR